MSSHFIIYSQNVQSVHPFFNSWFRLLYSNAENMGHCIMSSGLLLEVLSIELKLIDINKQSIQHLFIRCKIFPYLDNLKPLPLLELKIVWQGLLHVRL